MSGLRGALGLAALLGFAACQQDKARQPPEPPVIKAPIKLIYKLPPEPEAPPRGGRRPGSVAGNPPARDPGWKHSEAPWCKITLYPDISSCSGSAAARPFPDSA